MFAGDELKRVRLELEATRLALKDLSLIAAVPLFKQTVGRQINPHPGNLAFAAIEAANEIRETGVGTTVADDMAGLLIEHYRDQVRAEPQDISPGRPAK